MIPEWTYFAVKFDCSEPVLSQDAVDIVERILPEARVPRFSKSLVLRCLRIFKPWIYVQILGNGTNFFFFT